MLLMYKLFSVTINIDNNAHWLKRESHQASKVQARKMQGLDKLVPDEDFDAICRQLNHYISGNGATGINQAMRDQGNLSSLKS